MAGHEDLLRPDAGSGLMFDYAGLCRLNSAIAAVCGLAVMLEADEDIFPIVKGMANDLLDAFFTGQITPPSSRTH